MEPISKRRLPSEFDDKSNTKKKKSAIRSEIIPISQNEENLSLLPCSYKELFNLFVCLDTTVNILVLQKVKLLFSNIKSTIYERIGKTFTKEDFGKILSVFPECYKYEIDSESKELRIIPNLLFGLDECDGSPRKTDRSLSLGQILLRKKNFYDKLFVIVEKSHNNFMKKSRRSTRRKVKRWNEAFNLENECPELQSITFDDTQISMSPFVKKFRTSLQLSFDEKSPCLVLFKKDTLNSSECQTKSNSNECKENLVDIKEMSQSSENKTEHRDDLLYRSQKLPFHMKVLYDLFTTLDVVFASSKRNCMCFTELGKKMSRITMNDIGKILQIYKNSYNIKWIIVKKNNNNADNFDLQLEPNLLNDGAVISELQKKNNFDIKRRMKRCHIFLDKCTKIIEESYKKFMITQFQLSENEATYKMNQSYHSDFNLALHVPLTSPIEFPQKPVILKNQKITSFLPQKKTTDEVLSDKPKEEVAKLSVLEKIRLRNAKINRFSKKHVDEMFCISEVSKMVEMLNQQFKTKQKIPMKELTNLLVINTRKSSDEVERLIDLLQKASPGWLSIQSNVASLRSGTTYSEVCDNISRYKQQISQVERKLMGMSTISTSVC